MNTIKEKIEKVTSVPLYLYTSIVSRMNAGRGGNSKRMATEKIEKVAKVSLYISIFSLEILNVEKIDFGTVMESLVHSGILWGILWFLYVFVRDAVIAYGWKKPKFPLPQYEREDMEMDLERERMSYNSNDPFDPENRNTLIGKGHI